MDDSVLLRSGGFWRGDATTMGTLGGSNAGLDFLYYFERYTSSRTVTKIGMPLLATAVGLLPHVIQRIHFVFIIFSIAFGVAALVLFYFVASSYLSGSFFSTKGIGLLVPPLARPLSSRELYQWPFCASPRRASVKHR